MGQSQLTCGPYTELQASQAPFPDLVKHLRRLDCQRVIGLILSDIQVCSERIPRYSSSAFVGSVGAMLLACSRSADVFDIGSVDIVGE